MKRLLFWLTLLTGCASALEAQRSPSHIAGTGSSRACGVERWRVKILADDDRSPVRWTPTPASISGLRELPVPAAAFPPSRRVAPYELQLYRVHAVVRQILTESDGDWHIVLADPEDPRATMVAEIPDSSCALGSGHEADYAAARRALRAVPRGALVELDVVGFFDFLHGQRGMAPNGFELHPVVAIHPTDYEGEEPGVARSGALLDSSLLPRGSPGGSQEAPRRGAREDTSTRSAADVQVWLNTNSMVYHCQGTRWYGNTRYGAYMRESEAVAQGARPAYGRRCSL